MNNGIDLLSYTLGKKKGGTTPTGEIDITQNGITNVSGYATANVQVPEPSGTINITQNGETNVKNYETANVNVPQPSGKITITENGTDIDVSSYASADVSVPAGADLSDYFESTVKQGNNNTPGWVKLLKKFPELVGGEGVTYAFANFNAPNITKFDLDLRNTIKYNYMFMTYKNSTIDLSSVQWGYLNETNSMFGYSNNLEEIDLSNLGEQLIRIGLPMPNWSGMFEYCTNLKKLDLSNLYFTFPQGYIGTHANTTNMFNYCTKMEEIDMSKLDFTKLGTHTNMFGASASNGVPNNCLILVKDQTQKDWVESNFSRLTNVQIKSEYIANQGA